MSTLLSARALAFLVSLASVVPGGLSAQDRVASDSTYWSSIRLWYEQPASAWNEALPVGNGRLGAMVEKKFTAGSLPAVSCSRAIRKKPTTSSAGR